MTREPPLRDETLLIRSYAPADLSAEGIMPGTWLLSQVDHAAGVAGPLHVGRTAIMVAIEALTFHAPLPAKSVFTITSSLVNRGRTSFQIAIIARAGTGDNVTDVLSATLSMIAVDSAGKPTEITA